MFGKCKACAEKDARIRELREHIQVLRALVVPEFSPLPVVEVPDGVSEPPEDETLIATKKQQLEEAHKAALERDRMLGGA